MKRLEGKTCLIVGGTSGIGRACSVLFRSEGAEVVASGIEVDSARFEAGLRITTIEADVRDRTAIDLLFDRALALLGGRLDVLLHVAGIGGRKLGDGALADCTDLAWETVIDANARGVFWTNRAAVRLMRAQTPDRFGIRGSIVNVGSVLARSPSPERFGTIAYAASKGAVEALTIASASAYAAERIRFNVVAPGLIATPMSTRAVEDPAIMAYLATKQPLAGGPGTVDDVAHAALYLCEPTSRLITGVVLSVDGGWSVSEGKA